MNTSATLEHLRNRLDHVRYDLDAERNAQRNGYGARDTFLSLIAKHDRLSYAVRYLDARRAAQLAWKR